MKNIILLLAISLTAFSCSKPKPHKAPDFEIPAADGSKCTLSGEKGKVVLLELWSLSCPYCIKQAAELQILAEKINPAEVAILSVHARGGVAVADKVKAKINHKNIKVCLDDKTLWAKMAEMPDRFKPRGIPHMLIIDKKGQIREVHRGLSNASDLLKSIKNYL